MESLACATPVVAFNIGGMADLIDNKENGYLAKPYNVFDLAYGVKYILENNYYHNISKNSRKKLLIILI